MKKLFLFLFWPTLCFAHTSTTWSIIVRDQDFGQLLAEAASKDFNVIRSICRAQAGVGLVLSMGRRNPAYFHALDLIESGLRAEEAMPVMLRRDFREIGGKKVNVSEERQVAIVDAKGGFAIHSGKETRMFMPFSETDSNQRMSLLQWETPFESAVDICGIESLIQCALGNARVVKFVPNLQPRKRTSGRNRALGRRNSGALWGNRGTEPAFRPCAAVTQGVSDQAYAEATN